MRVLLSILLMAFVLVPLACDAVELVIVGNSDVSGESIADVASSVCSMPDSGCVRAMCEAVAEYYWEKGYLDLSITCESIRDTGDTVLISITEGRLSKLRSVSVVGSRAFSASRLERTFDDDIGKPFSRAGLERGITSLLELYDRNGFPAAAIEPETVIRDEGWVDITLRADEGRRARIGRVIFEGLTRTRRGILLAESGIREGSTYDGGRIGEAVNRLEALGIFDSVSEPVLSFGARDSVVAVTFEVVEARNNRLEGLLAYAPSQEEGKLVGSLDLLFGNIAGTLRRLRVFYDRSGSDRLRWNVAYREPRLIGLPVALEVGLASDVIESSFARRRLTVGFQLRGEPRLEVGVGGILGVTKDRSQGLGEGDFSEKGGSFFLRYEGRDRPMNPLSGGMLAVSHEVVVLDFDSEDVRDRTLSSLRTDAEYVKGMTTRNVAAIGVRFEGAFAGSGPIPRSHVIRLGGAGSLRGYPEEWFSVLKALVVTFEVRRMLGSGSRMYAFIDGATLEDGTREFGDLEDFPFGYGVGFMGGARSGVFRLEIALGREDGISDAKLHLGLVQRF